MQTEFRILSRNLIQTPPFDEGYVKKWLRVTDDSEDALISDLIMMAYSLVSAYLDRTLLMTEMLVQFSPAYDKVVLPYAPIDKVVHVTDVDGNELDFTFDGVRTITLLDVVPPTGFRVMYTAGSVALYKDAGLRQIILSVIGLLWEHRGSVDGVDISTVKDINLYSNRLWI